MNVELTFYYSLYRVMSGQVFAATELPTSATVDADSETLSELHHSLYETESMPLSLLIMVIDFAYAA